MELDEKQLRTAVREAMREILAEQKPMPLPAPAAPVAEIVIRTSSPEAILTTCACPDPVLPLNDRSKKLLQSIEDKTREAPGDVIRKLELRIRGRQLDEEIEEEAKRLGIE